MRWLACFLGLLILAAGCVLEDKPVIPADGGVEAGMCGLCPVDTPICNDDFECVECDTSSDCSDPDAARCNPERSKCEACQGEPDCTGIDGLPRCEAGTCVECTPGTEEADCGGTSCNPRTLTCTETTLASRETCQTCVSDSDCKEAGNRCVAMTYQGAPYPDMLTGFCLKTFTVGDPCERPYLVPLLGRESLSGPPEANFCGINEANVTCPAVLALLNNVECLSGEDSECPESGLCRDFVDGLAEDRCTYLCSDADECKKPPVAGSSCGSSGSGGAGGGDYCGG